MADVLAVRTDIDRRRIQPVSDLLGRHCGRRIVSAAFTLFLVELVAGLGLVMVPWSQGASASTLSVAGGIGLILMAVMASALGGYIAGRLRTRWVGIKTDEVYFRDTAHGLLAWAVGTIILATVLASAAGTMVSSVTQGASSNPALVPDRNSYYVDSLFRSDRRCGSEPGRAEQANAEASRLFARAVTQAPSSPGTTARASRKWSRRAPGCRSRKPSSASTRSSRRPRPRLIRRARRPPRWRSGWRPRCSPARSRHRSQRSKAGASGTIEPSREARPRAGAGGLLPVHGFQRREKLRPCGRSFVTIAFGCSLDACASAPEHVRRQNARQRQKSASRMMMGSGMPKSQSKRPRPKPMMSSRSVFGASTPPRRQSSVRGVKQSRGPCDRLTSGVEPCAVPP